MYLIKRNQRGVSLVESMIALVVISIGLLGIAALQITSMKQNATALNHSQAVWMAYNMADRIRSNINQFVAYSTVDTSSASPQDCMTGACNTTQMVLSDAADWKTQVENLPAGRGMVTGDATQLLISVMWDDEGTNATGTGCDPTNASDMVCYRVTLLP
jgi:type IV pilus assembly protein PilV